MSKLICADAAAGLKILPSESVQMCVTSPPYYGLRDYGTDGQIGIEQTPREYIAEVKPEKPYGNAADLSEGMTAGGGTICRKTASRIR